MYDSTTIKTSCVLLGYYFPCDSSTSSGPFPSLKRALYVLSAHVLPRLLAVLILFTCAALVMAADRVVLENATQAPLRNSNSAEVIRAAGSLTMQAKANGTTRIIVGLRVAFAPEGTMDAASVAQQRNEISRMQSAVLEKVPSVKQRPKTIKRYDNIPFMALEVNAAELETLVSLTEITSIEADRIATPALGNSIAVPERN